MIFLRSFPFLFLFFFLNLPWGVALELDSKQAILIDLTTGTVLFEKNADEPAPPSSMTKLMTIYLTFQELKSGRISKDTLFKVSEKAWKMGGSRMFLNVNTDVKVDDLLRGVIVQSGNDASVVLAEGIAGSEETFAERMTAAAKDLGATNTVFLNATGWPAEGHVSTVRDLALIGQRTILDFPEYYPLYKEREFTYNNIPQMNRNPLLYTDANADGLKTGFTEQGGYGVVASSIKGPRRLLLAINGARKPKNRAEDAKVLMGWGFHNFASPRLFQAMEVVEQADVWLGKDPHVPLIVKKDVFVTVPSSEVDHLKVALVYKAPLEAPVKKDQEVGKLLITSKTMKPVEIPVFAAADVELTHAFSRFISGIRYLFLGHN